MTIHSCICLAAIVATTLSCAGLHAVEVVTIDGPGVVTIAGTAPAAPAAAEVRIGAGQVRVGTQLVVEGTGTGALQVTGGAAVGNMTLTRSTQATGNEAVRGDDPRLSDARVAVGGNADTVAMLAPADLVKTAEKAVAGGVASLDAGGKVPAAQLPTAIVPRGMQVFIASGTFTVPADVTRVVVEVWGGGGGFYSAYKRAGGGGAYAMGLVDVTPGAAIAITVGAPGTSHLTAPTHGGTSSFAAAVVAGGGRKGSDGGAGGTATAGLLLLKGQDCIPPVDQPYYEADGVPGLAPRGGFPFPGRGGGPGQTAGGGLVVVQW